MTKTISINKYEYNQRMVLALDEEILSLEKELKETKGIINNLKLKLKLRKLYKKINNYGQETLMFEINKYSQ